MAEDIDYLQIQINAQATKANDAIDKLIGKLDRLTASLSAVNGNNLYGLANGVERLGNAMQTMNNVKTSDFTRLANNLTKLNGVDSSKLGSISLDIHKIVSSLQGLQNVPDSAKQLIELANALKQLGYKSAEKAIQNIPQLATAMKQLMSELSKAPKVSQNLIDMTNALAKLARTGASSGRAATSLSKALTGYSSSATKATKQSFSLASAIGKVYATYWMLFRIARKLKDAIDISSDLTEVQNVVDVTFGKYASLVEDMSKTSITDFGMSELTVKEVSSRFQAMGTAMGFAQGKMADMSIELTKLTADMASFYNVEQEDVAQDLESIFTGQTRPLRTYGLDLTEATLKEWALKQGIDANIDSMSQAEKTMLRYKYVLANTTNAQGDFARTADTWANQVRILKQNFEALGAVIGRTFINMLKPIVSALNVVIGKLTEFATAVSNALGKIFGWKFEESGTGGVASDLDDAEDSSGGLADNLGTAADNAKKLKSNLLAIDELNVLNPNTDTSTSGSSSGDLSSIGASSGEWVQQESILKEFESEIDSLYKLGEYIRDALIGAMESIDWDSVYEKARGFGKGLAEFLNGLLAYDGEGKTLFGEVGKTLANTLNTVVYSALEFAKEFDFYQFGVNIADGINQFFENFDFESLAETLNAWIDGLIEAIRGFLETIKWSDILDGINDFLGALEIDTVEVLIGAFVVKNSATNLLKLLGEAIIGKFTFSITIPEVLLFISSFALGNMSGASFQVVGEQIIGVLEEVLSGILPSWLQDFIGGFVAGFSVGGIFSGGNPIVALITGLIGGIFNIKIDGKSIAHHLLDPIFNWDATREVWESAKENFKKGGLSIVLGIGQGILAAFGFILEPIGDFFVFVFKTICSVFGIHSPAKEMEPLGENILRGIIEGFRDKVSEFSEAVSEWWNESVAPWFTTEQWKELWEEVKRAFTEKWDEIVNWWNNTAIVKWWNENVKPWFTKEKWTFSGIWEGLKSSFDAGVEAVKEVWNSFANWLNEKLTWKIEPVVVFGKTIFEGTTINLGKIPTFETGGFPEDGWFRASKGEYFGQFDDGTSYIANNNQIELGVAVGVKQAVREAMSEMYPYLADIAQNTKKTADKNFETKIDGRTLVAELNSRKARNGFSFT